MIEGVQIVRINRKCFLLECLIALGHEFRHRLQERIVCLHEVLNRGHQFLPFPLRQRDQVIRAEILLIHAHIIPALQENTNMSLNPLFIFATVVGSQAMAVGAKERKVVQAVVVRDAVDVMQFQRKRLTAPLLQTAFMAAFFQ